MTKPAGDGSDWTVDFEIKASVPLIGGKIEKMVAEETKASLVKEFAFKPGLARQPLTVPLV